MDLSRSLSALAVSFKTCHGNSALLDAQRVASGPSFFLVDSPLSLGV